jgi:hypothetical protein
MNTEAAKLAEIQGATKVSRADDTAAIAARLAAEDAERVRLATEKALGAGK